MARARGGNAVKQERKWPGRRVYWAALSCLCRAAGAIFIPPAFAGAVSGGQPWAAAACATFAVLLAVAAVYLFMRLCRQHGGGARAGARRMSATLPGFMALLGLFLAAAVVFATVNGLIAMLAQALLAHVLDSGAMNLLVSAVAAVLGLLALPVALHVFFTYGTSGKPLGESIRRAFATLRAGYARLLPALLCGAVGGALPVWIFSMFDESLLVQLAKTLVYTAAGAAVLLFMLRGYPAPASE